MSIEFDPRKIIRLRNPDEKAAWKAGLEQSELTLPIPRFKNNTSLSNPDIFLLGLANPRADIHTTQSILLSRIENYSNPKSDSLIDKLADQAQETFCGYLTEARPKEQAQWWLNDHLSFLSLKNLDAKGKLAPQIANHWHPLIYQNRDLMILYAFNELRQACIEKADTGDQIRPNSQSMSYLEDRLTRFLHICDNLSQMKEPVVNKVDNESSPSDHRKVSMPGFLSTVL